MPKTTSGITQESQELRELLCKVESQIGYKPRTGEDYDTLRDKILEKTKNSIETSSLKRLWGYEKNYKSAFSYRTINILAQAANYENWDKYINSLNSQNNKVLISPSTLNPIFSNKEINDAEKDLSIGQILTLGWPPERYAIVRYKGDCEFEIIEYKGKGRDLTHEIIIARWFEIIKVDKGNGTSMDTDIAGVIGGDTYERLYL